MKIYNESANSLNSVVFYDDNSATALIVYPRNFEYRTATVSKKSKDIRARGKKISYEALEKIRDILDLSGYKQRVRTNRIDNSSEIDVDDDFSNEFIQTELPDEESDYNFGGDL